MLDGWQVACLGSDGPEIYLPKFTYTRLRGQLASPRNQPPLGHFSLGI
jgi:hypothetical protein